MGRKNSRGGGIVKVEEATIDRMVARGASKLAPLAPPWIVAGGMLPAGAITHAMWGAPGVLPWMSAGMTAAGLALTGLTWVVSHARGRLGRAHSTITTGTASAWLTVATITGPTAGATLDVGLLAGAGLAVAWNIRGVIRSNGDDDGESGGRGLKAVFGDAAEAAGLEGTVLKRIDRKPRKVTATAELDGGRTAEDLQKRLRSIESSMGLPPNSLTIVEDEDDAGAARVTFSNPKLMKEPIPYEGPSRPGKSIAEPIRVGVHQDGEDSAWTVLNHHSQVMGKTGVAKSFGGFWNFGGEVMTRHDAALFVVDLDKGEQTVGPMRRGLHRVELDLPGAKRLLDQFHKALRPRMDYLSSKGLKEWQEGCGLTFLVLWLEEFPTLGKKIDMEDFIDFLRTARSAGVHVVLSLQRSDWTQMPTFVRGQLSYWCFGVANSHDAGFGLSELQQEAGARPELWASKPGLSVLDAPGADPDRIAMPLRTPMWETAQMVEHAAAFPAVDRPLDPITAKYLSTGPGGWADPSATEDVPMTKNQGAGGGVRDDETAVPVADELTTHDDDPANPDDINAPIEDANGEWEFTAGGKLKPEQAQLVLRTALNELRQRQDEFAPRDLKDVLTRTGHGRGWIQKHLRLLSEAGELEHNADAGTYRFRELAPA